MFGSTRADIRYPLGVIRPVRLAPRPLSGLAELLGVGRAMSIEGGAGHLVRRHPRLPRGAARRPVRRAARHPHPRRRLQRPGGGRRGGRDPDRPRRPRPGGPHRRPRLRGVQPARPPGRRVVLDLRRPVAPDDDDRRDRDQRQDHHQLPVRGRAARRRAHHRADRRGGDQDRRGADPGVADHAGGAGPAGAAGGDGRARGDRGRDGGLEPLARPRPGRRAPATASPCSPTCPRTTWTSTPGSRTTSGPRRSCSPPRTRPSAWSTWPTATAAAWWPRPRSRSSRSARTSRPGPTRRRSGARPTCAAAPTARRSGSSARAGSRRTPR